MPLIPEVEFEEVHAIVCQIVAIERRSLRVRIAVEMVQPLQIGRHVIPADISHLLHSRLVVTGEERQKQLIAPPHRPVQFHVHIKEIEGIVLEVFRGFQEHVHIGAPCSQQKRHFVLHEWPFDRSFGR